VQLLTEEKCTQKEEILTKNNSSENKDHKKLQQHDFFSLSG